MKASNLKIFVTCKTVHPETGAKGEHCKLFDIDRGQYAQSYYSDQRNTYVKGDGLMTVEIGIMEVTSEFN